jgi:hypothetical protein
MDTVLRIARWSGIVLLDLVLFVANGSALGASAPSYLIDIDGSANPSGIPLPEATFVFFEQVVSIEQSTPTSGIALLRKYIGLDERVARRMYGTAQAMVTSARRFSAGLTQRLCANQQEFQTADRLVAAYNRIDRDMEIERERLLAGAGRELGAENKMKLDSFIQTTFVRQLRGKKIDYSRWIDETKEKPRAILARRCRKD